MPRAVMQDIVEQFLPPSPLEPSLAWPGARFWSGARFLGDPNVCIQSMFMNDADKNLESRLHHLLSKSYPNRRYVWLVGDSTDDTWSICCQAAEKSGEDVTVVLADTGLSSITPEERVLRGSRTAERGLLHVRAEDHVWMFHESDLTTPVDIVEKFLLHWGQGRRVVGGWITLRLGDRDVFYDIWAYRKNGRMFENGPPYHPDYVPGQLTEMESVGSCWIFPAQAIRDGLTVGPSGVVSLCGQLRGMGYKIWMDPSIHIIQPTSLWTAQAHATVAE